MLECRLYSVNKSFPNMSLRRMKNIDLENAKRLISTSRKPYCLSGTARYKWACKLECREWSSTWMRIASDTSHTETHEHCAQLQAVVCRTSNKYLFLRMFEPV